MEDTTRQTILIIDDNLTNLRVAVEYLKAYSYRILTARDGQSGLERAIGQRPDLILLDVQMPGIDGFEVCRRLMANPTTESIPIIFMTAMAGIEDKVRGFDAGAVDFVTKPVEERELLARVRTHLQLRRLQAQMAAVVSEKTAMAEWERERREVQEALTERLEKTMEAQSSQIETLTRRWLEAQSKPEPLSPSIKDALVRAHLLQARERLHQMLPGDDLVESAYSHVTIASELCDPHTESQMWEEIGEEAESNPFAQLSEREVEIARFLVRGMSNKEIAYELDLARTTISTYRKRMMKKLGVVDLTDLIKLTIRHGIGA